ELDFVTIVTSSRALAAGHTEPPLAVPRVLTCWLRVGEGFRSRGCAQADDEDSMDASDVTPTPDIDITPEMGEDFFKKDSIMIMPAFFLRNLLEDIHFMLVITLQVSLLRAVGFSEGDWVNMVA
ncbi:hypothetical protein PO909_016841, partial [Leuciscus waleckii]